MICVRKAEQCHTKQVGCPHESLRRSAQSFGTMHQNTMCHSAHKECVLAQNPNTT